jgi:hypothetical protein
LANEAEDAAKVIGKDYASKPGAVDQTCSLEYMFVLLGNRRLAMRIAQWDIVRVLEGITLVDLKQLVGDILRCNDQQLKGP